MGTEAVGFAVTADPIREWAERRAQAQREAIKAEPVETREEPAESPPVESLTAGGTPSSYTPPSVGEQFREWARESTYRGGVQPPPAA